jgi:hypothetical protein
MDIEHASVEQLEAALAAKKAQLAAMEPDYEVWRPAVEAYRDAFHWSFHQLEHINPEGDHEKHIVEGLIAALPLAPKQPVAVDVEALARECVFRCTSFPSKGMTRLCPEEVAITAIRETLALPGGASWPSEAELREMAAQVAQKTAFDTYPTESAALEMARRLREYQTGAKP